MYYSHPATYLFTCRECFLPIHFIGKIDQFEVIKNLESKIPLESDCAKVEFHQSIQQSSVPKHVCALDVRDRIGWSSLCLLDTLVPNVIRVFSYLFSRTWPREAGNLKTEWSSQFDMERRTLNENVGDLSSAMKQSWQEIDLNWDFS